MRYWGIIFCILVGLNGYAAYGKESGFVTSKHDQASILTEMDSHDGRQERVLLGLRIRLQPGWHTYWINPGDAGEPASVHIRTASSVKDIAVPIEWPVPQLLFENGLTSYIYKGDVILPFYVNLPRNERMGDLVFMVRAEWLVCLTVCVPEQGEFTVHLPYGTGEKAKEAALLYQALAQKPKKPDGEVNITPSGVLWMNRMDRITGSIHKAWFMPEKQGLFDQDKPQTLSIKPQRIELRLPLLPAVKLDKVPAGILALQTEGGNTEYLSVQPVVKDTPPDRMKRSVFLFLGSAFLGGVLLNFMPCVFPVLAMKLLSLSRMREQLAIYRYKSGCFYTLGILVSFTGIAILFTVLRWMGNQMGWGVQFQSLSFLMGLCWLLLVIALNLLDVFMIRLAFGGSLRSNDSSGMTEFFTGVLAVLVATPCTAPFMGVAVAAALTQSLTVSVLVFIMIGLGLAFPYLLLALVPWLTRFLPKPGVWMEIFRQLLAFPLLLSCVWLVWVIYQHQHPVALLLVLLGSVIIGFSAWLWGVAQKMSFAGKGRVVQYMAWFSTMFATVFLIMTLVYVNHVQQRPEVGVENGQVAFSIQTLNRMRAEHRPVFVNMTASWCLTCLANDRIALSSERVRNYFRDQHIVYMVGDWTHHDDEISHFLSQFDREGIPLYVYYPVDGGPHLLPQILTPGLVLNHLRQISGH